MRGEGDPRTLGGPLPALQKEEIELLKPQMGAVAIDCTLGQAGHARQILDRIEPGGRLLGIDRDSAAVEAARSALASYGEAVVVVQSRFSDLDRLARTEGFVPADLILFDFGLSSVQLDSPERGFSFRADGPLDMRMDTDSTLDAARIVNTFDVKEIERILRDYGEQRCPRLIAHFLAPRRPLR